jgi:pantetheine-phosphate adenylyltransferase
MTKSYSLAPLNPIHYGHVDIAMRAARLFDEVVVAVYDKPLKNLLFTPRSASAWCGKCSSLRAGSQFWATPV